MRWQACDQVRLDLFFRVNCLGCVISGLGGGGILRCLLDCAIGDQKVWDRFSPGDRECRWRSDIEVRFMMSPSSATSVPPSIKADLTDDEIMLFLGRRRSGDPLPFNIITEVNPFSFDPWNAPDNIWYLCNSKEPIFHMGERETRSTSSGYWKDMGRDLKISTGTHTVGRIVTWEFFGGAAPSGDKIGWTMFEYKLEKTEFQATDGAQDFNSLCRVFMEEPQHSASLDDADGDYIQSVLLGMLEQEEEEENINLLESTYRSQGLPAVSNRSLEDSGPNRSADSYAACDFSNGDFLELNDLYDPESSSSSSDNSSCVSQSSDEYFDSEALLRDLENENKLIAEGHHTEHHFSVSRSLQADRVVVIAEGHHTEHHFSVSRSLRADRVVVQPPSQSSVRDGGGDLVTLGKMSAASASGRGPQPVGSLSLLPVNRNGGASGHYQGSQETNSSSQRAGTSQGSVSNRVGRIAKLGKKYFCFAS